MKDNKIKTRVLCEILDLFHVYFFNYVQNIVFETQEGRM